MNHEQHITVSLLAASNYNARIVNIAVLPHAMVVLVEKTNGRLDVYMYDVDGLATGEWVLAQ